MYGDTTPNLVPQFSLTWFLRVWQNQIHMQVKHWGLVVGDAGQAAAHGQRGLRPGAQNVGVGPGPPGVQPRRGVRVHEFLDEVTRHCKR